MAVERLDGQELPDVAGVALACDVLLGPAEALVSYLEALRSHAESGALPVAVFGPPGAGLAALDAGADLWLEERESGQILGTRLAALARRAVLGGTPRLDTLTGLTGGRWLRDLLHHEFERSARYRRSVGLVVMEADAAEDPGPGEGIPPLPELAALLRTQVRDVDLLGRLGGSRFALILPETDAGGALTAAERLRAAVEEFSARGTSAPTRVSIGVAAFPSRGMEKAEDLLGRALEALVQARRRGGNRVVPFGAGEIIWSRTAPDPRHFD